MDAKKKIRMVRTFLFFLGVTGMFFPVVSAQDDRTQSPSSFSGSKSDIGMETIVITLNKTLEENKKLLNETEKMQRQFQKMAMENNVLKAQIIELNQGRYQLRDDERKVREEAERKISELDRKMNDLEAERKALIQSGEEIEKKMALASAENEKLKQLVETLVPGEEKVAYDNLVERLGGRGEASDTEAGDEKVSKLVEVELGALYYSLGNMLFESGDYKGAEVKYKKALELNPKDSWAHYNLGIIFDFYLNNDPEAVVHYKEYIRLAPDAEDANKIRERLSDINLLGSVVPSQPIKADFDEHVRKFS